MEEVLMGSSKEWPGLVALIVLVAIFLYFQARADVRREETIKRIYDAANSTMSKMAGDISETLHRIDTESTRREDKTSAALSKCADAMTRMSLLAERLEGNRKTAGST